MKLPKAKRKELRKQLAEAGVEKKSRRRVKRAVRSEVRSSEHKTPKMTFNFAVGDLVRPPKKWGKSTVMIVEIHQSGSWYRFMDPNSGQLCWVKAAQLRPA